MHIWRRSYDVRPPALSPDDERDSISDPRYAGLSREQVPLTECLQDTVARVLPAWYETIAPQLAAGKNVLIAAHGNSLRALVKHLENIADDAIVAVEIPNGVPLVYDFDAEMKPTRLGFMKD